VVWNRVPRLAQDWWPGDGITDRGSVLNDVLVIQGERPVVDRRLAESRRQRVHRRVEPPRSRLVDLARDLRSCRENRPVATCDPWIGGLYPFIPACCLVHEGILVYVDRYSRGDGGLPIPPGLVDASRMTS